MANQTELNQVFFQESDSAGETCKGRITLESRSDLLLSSFPFFGFLLFCEGKRVFFNVAPLNRVVENHIGEFQNAVVLCWIFAVH